jgi:hypothetical protein
MVVKAKVKMTLCPVCGEKTTVEQKQDGWEIRSCGDGYWPKTLTASQARSFMIKNANAASAAQSMVRMLEKRIADLDTSTQRGNPKFVANVLGDFVNGFGHDKRGFCEAMGQQHRTLQQAAFSMFLAWAYHIAKLDAQWFDARNEMMRDRAIRITQALGPDGQHLPCI